MMETDSIIDLDNPEYNVPPLRIGEGMKAEEIRDKENKCRRPRRFSVSAEESNEHCQKVKDMLRKIYPKKPEAVERIRHSVSEIFIWKGLDKEQQSSLIDAMFEKKVKKGEEVIRQGEKGDYFYVIESGTFDVLKMMDLEHGEGMKKVYSYEGKGSFGELALLYNAPRAATVRAASDGIVWGVDGETFRYIMISSRSKKRARFDEFLKTVDLFRNVNDNIRSEVADSLEVLQFEKGEYVISQGDKNAEHFYIIQHGSVEVTVNITLWEENINDKDAVIDVDGGMDGFHNSHVVSSIQGKEREKYVKTLREGSYFGERALLCNCERSANVVVSSQVLRCVVMDKASFLRFVDKTSVYDKIRRGVAQYMFSEKLNSFAPAEVVSSDNDSHDDF